jgi:hypothetical protein
MSSIPGSTHDVPRFFAPDIITPDQHLDRIRPASADCPEIRLMLAVMENGIATYLRYAAEAQIPAKRRARRLFGEAKAWVESADTSWPYSFENLCTALGFDPGQLRRGLGTWEVGNLMQRRPTRLSIRRINGSRHVIGAGTERRRSRSGARVRRQERAIVPAAAREASA